MIAFLTILLVILLVIAWLAACRGQRLVTPAETTAGYRPQLPGGLGEPNWSRRKRAWLKKLHTAS